MYSNKQKNIQTEQRTKATNYKQHAVMLEIVPTVLAITAAADATLPEDPSSSVTGVSGGPGMLPALALR